MQTLLINRSGPVIHWT